MGLVRARRLTLWAAATLLAVELGYVVGANLYLASSDPRQRINRKPEKLFLDWGHARTWLPGVVHLRDVSIRGQTRNVQWYAALDRARVTLHLLPLPWQRFHARSVSVQGLSFRLRRRLDAVRDELPDSQAWPPIPGLTNPPAPKPEAIYPPSRKKPWVLRFDRVRVESIDQLWIENWQVAGEARAEGRMEFEVRGPLTVEHAVLRLHRGVVDAGRGRVAEDVALEIEAAVETFKPRNETARSVWRHVSGRIDLDSQVSSLGFLKAYFDRAPWIGVDGAGALSLEARLRHGTIEPGSRLEAGLETAVVRLFEHEFRGTGTLRGRVDPESPPRGRLAVEVDGFEVRRRGIDQPYVRGTGFHLEGSSQGTDLMSGFKDLDLLMTLPASEVMRFEVYGAYLPPNGSLRLLSGTGRVEAALEVSTETMTGRGGLAIAGERIRAAYGDLHLSGDGTLRVELAPLEPDGERRAPAFGVPRSRLELSRVTVGDAARRDPEWKAALDLADAQLALSPFALSGRFDARFRDTRPLVAVFGERNFAVVLFGKLLTVEDVSARGWLEVDEQSLRILDLAASGRDMELLADLDLSRQATTGLLYARHGLLSVAVELGPEGRKWKLLGARRWFEQRHGQGRAAAALRHE